MPSYIVVAAAIVDGDPPRLLAAQRSYPHRVAGRWELPGGKVEDAEDEIAALVRECHEELGVRIEVGARAASDVPTVDGAATLRTYWARVPDATMVRSLDHAALRWLAVDELYDVEWLDADLPIVAEIADGITSRA